MTSDEDETGADDGDLDAAAADLAGDLGVDDVMNGEEEAEAVEWVSIDDELSYLGPLLRILSLSHSLISFCMLVAYGVLKVRHRHLKVKVTTITDVTACARVVRCRSSSLRRRRRSRAVSSSTGCGSQSNLPTTTSSLTGTRSSSALAPSPINTGTSSSRRRFVPRSILASSRALTLYVCTGARQVLGAVRVRTD